MHKVLHLILILGVDCSTKLQKNQLNVTQVNANERNLFAKKVNIIRITISAKVRGNFPVFCKSA